jgi:hypothetical protein
MRVKRNGKSVPQSEDQAEEHELHRVIAAIDEPEPEGSLGELVIDAEARRNKAKSDKESVDSAVCRTGAGPSRVAKANAATTEKTKLMRKTLAGCPDFGWPPFSRFHVRPNSIGEYHRPPRRKLETAATTIAGKFIVAPV